MGSEPPVLFVRQKEYGRLLERKQETLAAQQAVKAMQQAVDSLLNEEEAVKELIDQLETKGNHFQLGVENLNSDVLTQGLSVDRMRNRQRKERRSIRRNVKKEKKVVRQGKEMNKLERAHRYADGALKFVLSLFIR